MNLSIQEIIDLLNLTPHPTCGLVKQTFLSHILLPNASLPNSFDSDRRAGSVLYFMITQQTQIRLHKIRSDQMYHFYFGCPLEVLLLYPNGKAEIKMMGHDIKAGMLPQLFIPGDTFHMSRLCGKEEYTLLGTSEWIEVKPEDVEFGDPSKLIDLYSSYQDEIKLFTDSWHFVSAQEKC